MSKRTERLRMWTRDEDGNDVPDRPTNAAVRRASKRDGRVLTILCHGDRQPWVVGTVTYIEAAVPELSVLRLTTAGHGHPIRLDRSLTDPAANVQCRCGHAHRIEVERVHTLARRAVSGQAWHVAVDELEFTA